MAGWSRLRLTLLHSGLYIQSTYTGSAIDKHTKEYENCPKADIFVGAIYFLAIVVSTFDFY